MGEGLEREGEGGQASDYKFMQGLAQGGEAGAGASGRGDGLLVCLRSPGVVSRQGSWSSREDAQRGGGGSLLQEGCLPPPPPASFLHPSQASYSFCPHPPYGFLPSPSCVWLSGPSEVHSVAFLCGHSLVTPLWPACSLKEGVGGRAGAAV